MSSYSVADAKNGLPRLIDRALEGEEVVITRHGKPVVELRALLPRAARQSPEEKAAMYDRMRRDLEAMPKLDITTVEVLREMYEED